MRKVCASHQYHTYSIVDCTQVVTSSVLAEGRERNPPPCSPPYPGIVTVWGAYARLPLLPLPLPHPASYSCEIADSQPNHIFCLRLLCCQLLTETARQSDNIPAIRGKRVHAFNSLSHLVSPYWVLRPNLRPLAHTWTEPHSITNPPPSIVSPLSTIYISLVLARGGAWVGLS